MAKTKTRLEAARKVYREALEAARAHPTSESWARLLAAGKELSAATQPRRRSRRGRPMQRVPVVVENLEGPE